MLKHRVLVLTDHNLQMPESLDKVDEFTRRFEEVVSIIVAIAFCFMWSFHNSSIFILLNSISP